jgi:hypothetical protein
MLGMGVAIAFHGKNSVFSTPNNDGQEDPMAQKSKFIHDWISNLIENMDEYLDEKTKINLLEECGRACAESHAKEAALKNKGDLSGWLAVLKKWVGSENVLKEEHGVRVMYSKCLCPLVQDRTPLMSKTYCNCSRGWLMETFETVLEKPVEVKLEDSIMQGGKHCRFLVLFEA